MDRQDVCRMLGITQRTLQSYREKGVVPFSSVGGKFFYREQDIADYLQTKTINKR